MANYPRLNPVLDKTVEELERTLMKWADELGRELDDEDLKVESAPATKVNTVVSVGELGRPANGDIVFSVSAGKFRGYIEGTGWVDFN